MDGRGEPRLVAARRFRQAAIETDLQLGLRPVLDAAGRRVVADRMDLDQRNMPPADHGAVRHDSRLCRHEGIGLVNGGILDEGDQSFGALDLRHRMLHRQQPMLDAEIGERRTLPRRRQVEGYLRAGRRLDHVTEDRQQRAARRSCYATCRNFEQPAWTRLALNRARPETGQAEAEIDAISGPLDRGQARRGAGRTAVQRLPGGGRTGVGRGGCERGNDQEAEEEEREAGGSTHDTTFL